MDVGLTEEHEQLRTTVRSFLDHEYAFEVRREVLRSATGFRHSLWKAFATDLGILSMGFPERVGGLGLDPLSTAIVMEELGRSLVVEPYLETIVLCGSILSRAGGDRADELLAQIGMGEQIVAFAATEAGARGSLTSIATTARRDGSGWRLNGAKCVVNAAPWASQFLVVARTGGISGARRGLSTFLVDAQVEGLTLQSYPTVDGRRAADLRFQDVRLPLDALVGLEGEAIDPLEQALDAGIAALAAEAVGLLSQLHQDTVAYLKQRRQFGQPLAQFQVLRHRLVDMYLEIEMLRASALLATLKLSAPANERSLAASAAKVTVARVCRFAGQSAVQLHGGMGLTDELAVSHRFKRATMMELELGTADFHLMRHERSTRDLAVRSA